jgi:hypothetical protein
MPSQPLESAGWNFSPVFDLMDSNVHDVGSPTLRPAETAPTVALSGGGVGLGNFWKLYESLGMSNHATAPLLPPLDESELSNSDDLLPSPILEARKVIQAPLLQDTAAIDATPGTTKKQRRKARRLAEKAIQEDESTSETQKPQNPQKSFKVSVSPAKKKVMDIIPQTPTKPSRAQSNVGAKIRPSTPIPAPSTIRPPQTPVTAQRPVPNKRAQSSVVPVTPQPQTQLAAPQHGFSQSTMAAPPVLLQYAHPFNTQLQSSQAATPVSSGLVPRTVRPVTVPRHSHPASTQVRVPVTPSPALIPGVQTSPIKPVINIRSQVDRHFHLFEKLLAQFPEERKWLVAPRQLINESTTPEGVHVFVDASNIMIGFKDMLRLNGIQPFDMSFDSLALLMERRRPVAKRVFVGSHREANPLPQITRLVETSKAVGYECNVQEQVYIAREESKKKKFFNDVSRIGWQRAIQKRSGSGSDSETGAAAAPKTLSTPKWVEQGVDELLHLKMCQSLLDTELPSTMVLATGDGAEAEMSDGFLAHVERALRMGWKVELITWRQQTNGGYKRRAFRQKWGDQFTITELDDFLEDLMDTP